MNLFNVRKGQFVYYNNQLHKVYVVKPFFKQSVHLIRLNDFTHHFVTAKEIHLYRPQHLDSFTFNHKRYTLHKDREAQLGDYILVINPRPDSFDHHHLHAIEMVAAIEQNGVISHKMNGIRHTEYWVMALGYLDGATEIDLQTFDSQLVNEQIDEAIKEKYVPQIGDVFQKVDTDQTIQAMIVAIKEDTFYLGMGVKVTNKDLSDSRKWTYLFNIKGQ